MKRNLLLLITFLFTFSSTCYSADIELATPVATKLKVRQPNWKFETLTYHANGGAKEAVFFEPGVNQKLVPVKKVIFDELGKIVCEEDLIEEVIAEGDKEKAVFVPHGLGVALYPSGTKECIVSYSKGQLHGPLKSFYPSGKLHNDFNFSDGKFHGQALSYYESGQLKEKGFYNKGETVGEYITFYENGEQASKKSFKDGLLSGDFMEWYEDGTLKSTLLFHKGQLHSNAAPAVVRYNENEKVIEIQHFVNGHADGKHIRYHPNSSRSYQVSYVQGKKEGREEFLSENGKLLGGGVYKEGKPVKSHNIKYSGGKFQKIAQYNDKGVLQKPIEEFYANGQLRIRYSLNEEQKLEGNYLEWGDDGQLLFERCYSNGTLEGTQKEFFPNGQQKCEVNFSNGKQEGAFVQWYENGQTELKVEIKNGEKEGLFEQWHPDGHLKISEYYKNGKLNGLSQAWNSEHQLLLKAHFQDGRQNGLFQTWYDNGQLHQSIAYKSGKKDGLEETYYGNGQKKSSASYVNDGLNGKRWAWFDDGHVQLEGEYKNGAPIGKHHEYFPSSEAYSGHPLKVRALFVDGKRQGAHQELFPDGQQHVVINYNQGLLEGKKSQWNEKAELIEEAFYQGGKLNGRYYIRNGDLSEVIYHYKEDLKDGLHQMYYAPKKDGTKDLALKANYVNDLLEGDVLEYNLKGSLVAQTPFKNGMKQGTTKVFDNEGALRLSIEYSKGKHNGPFKQFFPSGQLEKETFYEKGLKHGLQQTYSEKGDLLSQYCYTEGKLDGYCYNKSKDGVVTFEAEYSNGMRHGKFNKFYDDGSPKIFQTFCQDKLQGTKSVYSSSGELTETQYQMGEKVK